MAELSVVVPVYGCGECLAALHERLGTSLPMITEDFELIFIDDRSRDDGWSVIRGLASRDPRVRGFRLSRNFGQHAAITAGLAQSRGQWVAVIDCDLQERPEDIPRLYAAAQAGYEIVRTVRRDRRHSLARRLASRLYRAVLLENSNRSDYSTLSLVSRRVADSFLRLRDKDREYTLALDWLGFDQTTLEVQHADRHAGQSAYTLRHLVRVALDGLFFRTTVLLRLVALLGFLIALVGAIAAAWEVYDYFERPEARIPGYASLAVLVLVLSGVIIASVGIVGLYVGRIFEQVKDRPLFIIDARAEGGTDVSPRLGTTSTAAPDHALGAELAPSVRSTSR